MISPYKKDPRQVSEASAPREMEDPKRSFRRKRIPMAGFVWILCAWLGGSVSAAGSEGWTDVLKGGVLSQVEEKKRPPKGTGLRHDGELVVTFDESSELGSFYYVSCPVDIPADKKVVLEARGRVISGLNAFSIHFKDTLVGVRLLPGEIQWQETKKKFARVTNDGPHTYRITASGGTVRVEMDDEMIFEGALPALSEKDASSPERITFGSGNSGEMGEAAWEFVRYRIE